MFPFLIVWVHFCIVCITVVYFEYNLHIVHGNYENVNIISLLSHVGDATKGNTYKFNQSLSLAHRKSPSKPRVVIQKSKRS